MVRLAVTEADRIRRLIVSVDVFADVLAEREAGPAVEVRGGFWTAYHAGMAAGLTGRMHQVESLFSSIGEDWPIGPAAAYMRPFLRDAEAFRTEAYIVIAEKRAEAKLPALDRSTGRQSR